MNSIFFHEISMNSLGYFQIESTPSDNIFNYGEDQLSGELSSGAPCPPPSVYGGGVCGGVAAPPGGTIPPRPTPSGYTRPHSSLPPGSGPVRAPRPLPEGTRPVDETSGHTKIPTRPRSPEGS